MPLCVEVSSSGPSLLGSRVITEPWHGSAQSKYLPTALPSRNICLYWQLRDEIPTSADTKVVRGT